jgi:hypothetical protein
MQQGLIGAIAALVLSASTLAAQQPQNASPDRRPGMGGGDRASMMMMDSLNHRLDSLVDRMNRTTGSPKVQAMAAVINELVAQRKTMQGRMLRMMDGGGTMGMMKDSPPASSPRTAGDSAPADTTDHSGHHPPQ